MARDCRCDTDETLDEMSQDQASLSRFLMHAHQRVLGLINGLGEDVLVAPDIGRPHLRTSAA